jgi:hypothetical protein
MSASAMQKEALLEELRQTCEQLGYRIRYEKGDFDGGHCILREQRLLIVNRRFTVDRKIATVARALGELGIDAIYIKPAIRELIENEMARDPT